MKINLTDRKEEEQVIKNIKIPQPKSTGLMLSYKCNARCLHCMYACSPEWKADWLSQDRLKDIIEILAGNIVSAFPGEDRIGLNYGLHFTGGEPFLNFDLLKKAVNLAHQYSIPSLFAETNSSWAVDDKTTYNKLKTLKDLGLKGILISVNPFFLEYVPFARVKRTVKISKQVFPEKNVFVYQNYYYNKFKEMGLESTLSFEDYLKQEGEDFAQNTEFFIMGRTPQELDKYNLKSFPKYPVSQVINQPCQPSFLRRWHNHIDNYGNYIPGYCGGISLGKIYNLDKLNQKGISPREYPVLFDIAQDNFQGLLELGREYGYQVKEEGYYSKCHLCLDIRKKLNQEGDFKELQPEQFYKHI